MKKDLTEIVAIVQDLSKGKHGLYAVATCDDFFPGQYFTVSLEKSNGVWKNENLPERGTRIVLGDLSSKGQWRANSARFMTPADELIWKEILEENKKVTSKAG